MKLLHTVSSRELKPGVAAVNQTFGDRINFHPHIHVLVTEEDTAPDGAPHHVYRYSYLRLLTGFAHAILTTRKLTVKEAINRVIKADRIKTSGVILIR